MKKIPQDFYHVASCNFKNVDEALVYTRQLAYDIERGIKEKEALTENDQNLLKHAKDADLIRPANVFTSTFKIARLYKDIYPDLRKTFKTKVSHLSSEEYESFEPLDESLIQDVKNAIGACIKDAKDHIILLLHYCIYYDTCGKEMLRYADIEERLKIPCYAIKKSVYRSIDKLRRYNLMPKIFEAPDEYNQQVNKLKTRLYEIHSNSIFREERSIIQELTEIEKRPFYYSGDKKDLLMSLKDDMPIEILDLSKRAYHFLKMNAFNKIADIIQYPSDKWGAINGLGDKTIDEIVAAMRACGYKNFGI